MLKSFAFHIICKCISKLHRRAAKNTRMTTFQLFKLSSPFQETFCNVEKCPKEKKKNRVFPPKSTKAILARKFNVWFSEIEMFSPAKNLQLQFRRENSNTWFPIFHKNLQLQFWLILTHKFKYVRFLILSNSNELFF